MGYRGPIPKPTVVEIAEGCPGKRPVNRDEPQPRPVAPKCPDYLDDAARKEWRRLVPVLKRMRVLTEADGIALGNLCQTYSTLIQAQEKLTKQGILYKAPSGYIWDSCKRNGITYRSYGEYGGRVSQPDGTFKMDGRVPGLIGHVSPKYDLRTEGRPRMRSCLL